MKTKNQIREEVRRKFIHKHKEEIDILNERINSLRKSYEFAELRAQDFYQENSKLKETIKELEDWNNRLLDWMDMSQEEREYAVSKYISNIKLTDLFQKFENYFSSL